MKSTIIKFGIYALIASLGLFILMFTLGQSLSYAVQEVLGYLTMVLSLLFIFFSIRHFKNNVNGNQLTFIQGIQIGLAISLFVALGTAVADYIYTAVLNPDFVEEYTTYQLETLKAQLSAEEFEKASIEMKEQINQIGSPHIMAAIMFVTVMILGFVITLLSSFTLYCRQVN